MANEQTPRAREQARESGRGGGSAGGDARKRQLVVVAEDEPREWEIYGKILWYNGFDVVHACDGEEALRLVREHIPDLVIMDLMMPKLNGLEVCRLLKEDTATAEIPVLALSARTRWEKEREARQAGCARYLQKPVGPVAVLHAVEEVIGRAPPAGEDGAEHGGGPRQSSPGKGGGDGWH